MIQISIRAMNQATNQYRSSCRWYVLVACAMTLGGVAACSRPSASSGGQFVMADTAFDKLFAVASNVHGKEYTEARDAILATDPADQVEMLNQLKRVAREDKDWKRQLTAEILSGWLTDRGMVETCTEYVRGNLPGPVPLPGFTPSHRAKAIAELGPSVTPRVLEMAYKTRQYDDEDEIAAIFGALVDLQDKRAVLPMIALIDEEKSQVIQRRALSVLAAIRDPRGFETVLQLARSSATDPAVRTSAIQNLGRFDDARASSFLLEVLTDSERPRDERRAAAEGLRNRADPKTRQPIAAALPQAQDQVIQITLIQTLGDIGSSAEIPALKNFAMNASKQLAEYASDAIEQIIDRERREASSPGGTVP
jgi:HEAT repeats